jgi:hypothetical protein
MMHLYGVGRATLAGSITRRIMQRCGMHVVLACAALLTGACGPAVDPSSLREIQGAWRTDAGFYEGRGFDVSADSIRLLQGGGMVVQYPIRSVERVLRDGRVEYTVTYQGIVQPIDFRFDFHPAAEPYILFPRQPRVIWTKRPA